MSTSIDYTVDKLISSIKRRITLPDAQNLYSNDDLIEFMNDEMASTIIPLIHSVQQEYWVNIHDVTLTQNQVDYKIPIRGAANGLRLVTMLDTNGNEIAYPLLRPEMTASASNWLSPYSTSTLYGFYMQDDHIVMFPNSVVTNPVNRIRFRFERQPNQLCPTLDAAHITAIDTNTSTITVDNIPEDWTDSLEFDWINGAIAFQSKGDDLTVSSIDTNTLEIIVDDLPTDAAVGDWFCLAGTSPIAQIPFQVFPFLAQCTANLCMAGMADTEPYADGKKKEMQMKEDLLKLLQPRDMGNVQTIVNRDGLFNNGAFWGWGSNGNLW